MTNLIPAPQFNYSKGLSSSAMGRIAGAAKVMWGLLSVLIPLLSEETMEELQRMLEDRLVVDPAKAVRKKAHFRVRNDPSWNGHGFCPLEVRGEDLS
jgi:hypothetical protein